MQLKPLFPKGTTAFVLCRNEKGAKRPAVVPEALPLFAFGNVGQAAGSSVCFLCEKVWTLHSQTTTPSTAQSTAAG